jgi:hypothetical protein
VAPTLVRDGQFRLFFFSREETRIHLQEIRDAWVRHFGS